MLLWFNYRSNHKRRYQEMRDGPSQGLEKLLLRVLFLSWKDPVTIMNQMIKQINNCFICMCSKILPHSPRFCSLVWFPVFIANFHFIVIEVCVVRILTSTLWCYITCSIKFMVALLLWVVLFLCHVIFLKVKE